MSPPLGGGLPAGALEPGRHAAYAWAAYGVSAVALAATTLDSWLRARRWRKRVEALEAERRSAGNAAAGGSP